uniref:Uncharacterized protein n=1 Tax=Anguilla anguilla TaxID=7936 RepID=A0A0E9PCU2_ANGAN
MVSNVYCPRQVKKSVCGMQIHLHVKSFLFLNRR